MSAWVRSATRRSLSVWMRSRCSWRFWASRISGAAYAAWVENARFNKMKGYGSQRSATTATLTTIQTATIAVWITKNRAVPNVRAIDSLNCPNASWS